MDSRVRGNDGGNPHILREKLILEFRQNDRKIKFTIPANAGISAEIPIYIGMEKRRNSAKKRCHSRESGNLFGEINFGVLRIFRESLEFPRIFFRKKRGECGILSVKMDSRVRGNDKQKNGGDMESSPLFYLPKSETMHRIYLESCIFGKIIFIFPSESGGGVYRPAVITEFALQI